MHVNINDIKEAARFALPHRIRNSKNQQNNSDLMDQDDTNSDNSQQPESQEVQNPDYCMPENNQDNSPCLSGENENSDTGKDAELDEFNKESSSTEGTGQYDERQETFNDTELTEDAGDLFAVGKWLEGRIPGIVTKGSGKRSQVITTTNQGRYIRSVMPGRQKVTDIAFDATFRAAAPYQLQRDKKGKALAINSNDIRKKVREKRTGNTILFVVDASGSMGANKRMKAVKGAILSLLNDAYQKRDKVGLIAFRNDRAETLLGITRSIDLAQKKLLTLPTGGRTPLAAGLDLAYETVKGAKRRDKDVFPVIALVTDGRATFVRNGMDAFEDALRSARRIAAERIKTIVVDTDQCFIRLNLGEQIADALTAEHFKIEDLQAEHLVAVVAGSV